MKRRRAIEIHALLTAIEQHLADWEADSTTPENLAAIRERLDSDIGSLRDCLWHLMPRDIAARMDIEDDLPLDRGTRLIKTTKCAV